MTKVREGRRKNWKGRVREMTCGTDGWAVASGLSTVRNGDMMMMAAYYLSSSFEDIIIINSRRLFKCLFVM